jgi:hypothetical protein
LINKKLLSNLVLAILFLSIDMAGQLSNIIKQSATNEKKDTIKIAFVDTVRKTQNKAFNAGEYFRFDVNYGFVTAGEAILWVRDTIYNDRPCKLVEFNLHSKPFFDAFYKVRDKYLTIIDAEGLFSWRFEQHIREGGFSRDFTAEFDQINHFAQTTKGKYAIPSYVQDIMSAFYYTRTLDFSHFKPGEKLHLQNFYKDSTYELDVKYKGIQTVDVEAGKFNCIIVEPLAKEGGLFKSEGKLHVWLSNDERKIPILVSAKILIGKVEAELIEYRGLSGPLPSKQP